MPTEVLKGQGPINITFVHPDAATPSKFGIDDDRLLSISLAGLELYTSPTEALGWTPEILKRIDIGLGAEVLGSGWSQREGYAPWAVGTKSTIELKGIPPARAYAVEFGLDPFVSPPQLPAQRLQVSVAGETVGQPKLTDKATIAFFAPTPANQISNDLAITIDHPDCASPKSISGATDDRLLSVALRHLTVYGVGTPTVVENRRTSAMRLTPNAPDITVEDEAIAVTGLSPNTLFKEFESLGDNCEFGLVQRHYGAEPLGLLRFSSVELRALLAGLDTGFQELGSPELIDPVLDESGSGEYIIYERKYSLRYHTFVYKHEASVDDMRKRESKKLGFLRDKFLRDLASSEKIFVFKRSEPAAMDEMLPVFLAMRRIGEAPLLWVNETEEADQVGVVEEILPGLFIGYVDRFAPTAQFEKASLLAWLNICANAYILARQTTNIGRRSPA